MNDPTPRGSVFASVNVTLRVELQQPWSGTETAATIVKVAKRDAARAVQSLAGAESGLTVLNVDTSNVTLRFQEKEGA